MKELLQFTSCLKVVLGNRIELQENLEKTRRELECHQRTVAALESGQSIGPDSFVGKLSKTFKDLTEGGDSVSNRHIALVKSREIIPSLEKNVKKLETDLKTFEESFSKELEYYEEMRLGDWNNILYNYAKSQVAYYENVYCSLNINGLN